MARGRQAPQSWQDFWDVANFPGKRALPDYPTYILPMALLADGVPVAELYPLDLDRAFASLEKIKDQVAVWWQAGAQPPQLLQDNEVQYAVSWSGRVAGQEGIAYSFKDGQLDLAFFAVPKGADANHKALANGIFYEMSVPENQAVAADVVSYTGNSPELEPLLPKDRIDEFPTTAGEQGGAVPLERQVVVRERRGGRDPLAGVQARPVSSRGPRFGVARHGARGQLSDALCALA